MSFQEKSSPQRDAYDACLPDLPCLLSTKTRWQSRITRREMFYLSSSVVASVLLVGCGGGISGEDAPDPTVVHKNVIVLPADGSLHISPLEADSSTITLTGTVPSLVVGSVIVSAQGVGLLRRVTEVVSTTPGRTTLRTASAKLTDVFKHADIAFLNDL